MVIIIICVLLLLAYLFDLTSSKTKIPSVILLLLLGWCAKQTASFFELEVPNLSPLLPILGTIGLILIVLEGSLELELNRTKFPLIKKSVLVAFLPMILLAFVLTFVFQQLGDFSFKNSLVNAIPLCVISSAIAIPSVRNLSNNNKEFIIYESSLSDILGVLFFNFIAYNDVINGHSIGRFSIDIIIVCLISFLSTIALSVLLNKIEHHIKFVPIMILVILIYVISKEYHLPALIFILVLGLVLGNLDQLKQYKWIERLKPDELDKEVHKFGEIVIEVAFLVRALFFLLFGYLIETKDLFNTQSLLLAIGIVAAIFLLRWCILKLSGMPTKPLLFVAPRGLITILLFLSIPATQYISVVNNSLIIQVIILSALVMMFGLMWVKEEYKESPDS